MLQASNRHDRKNINAFLNLGSIYTKISRFEQAVKYYKKALGLKRDHVSGNYNFGNCLWQLGNFDGAIEAYKTALEINPLYIPAWNTLFIPIIANQWKTSLEDVVGSISCNDDDIDEFNRLRAISDYQIHAGGALTDKYFKQATHSCRSQLVTF